MSHHPRELHPGGACVLHANLLEDFMRHCSLAATEELVLSSEWCILTSDLKVLEEPREFLTLTLLGQTKEKVLS